MRPSSRILLADEQRPEARRLYRFPMERLIPEDGQVRQLLDERSVEPFAQTRDFLDHRPSSRWIPKLVERVGHLTAHTIVFFAGL